MLGLTLGCNAVTRAAAGKQVAGLSNPPPCLARGEIRSFSEREEQASKIFEERMLSIRQELQALEDSRERFLVTLAAHPAIVSRPIVRNELGVRDLLGAVGVTEIRPITTNHRITSRYFATPPRDDRRSQVPASARSIAVAVLIEGSADNHLEDAEVQSLQRRNRNPPQNIIRGWSSLRVGIAERKVPGRCPDLKAGSRVEKGKVPHQREVPRVAVLLHCEDQFSAHCQRGLDPEVGPAVRQDILPPLRMEAPQAVVTHDNLTAMIEDHLCQRGRPLEAARFSAGESLIERKRTALLPVAWVTPRFFCFDGRGALICI